MSQAVLTPPTAIAPLVLVVDDDLDARAIYCGSLQHFGYRTIVRQNGKEAVEAARRFRPDAMLLDISMPILDGVNAARQIKRDAELRSTFIVLMTAFGDDRYAEGIGAGCDAYLCKPFNPLVVEEILRPLGRRAPTDIIKRCGCGRTYDLARWNELALCGHIEATELRNCASCGSSLALTRETRAKSSEARGPHRRR